MKSLKNAISLFAYLLIVWGFYRLFFQLDEVFEEVVLKPAIWLGGTYYFYRRERATLASIGVTGKNLFPSVYFALSLGAFFGLEGLAVNYLKHGGINFNANLGTDAFFLAIMISFVTAISEEVAFRGYIFTRLWKYTKNEWTANIITSIGWALVHMPVVVFVWQPDLVGIATLFLLSFTFSLGAGFVYARTNNIVSSTLLHVFWSWPIILFR